GKGLISPLEFIPVAEETGMIVALGRWMLEESCRQLRQWRERFPAARELSVSVNLSSKQIVHAQLLEHVRGALAQSGLPPTALKLEITESALMQETERAIALLHALKAMGIRILLDDFGTGYSSLAYLHRLPIDTLKVDRSFISHLHEQENDRHFVETIVQLARRLGQDVICEGVELPRQAEILAAMGVGYSQGFLYSRPVAAHEAEMLILAGLQPGAA
ncbi:MAG: EAL domain-containing protein, partial [Azovibrio sp.]|nr:EAL domain-containing protein [Azovibrio sp.]